YWSSLRSGDLCFSVTRPPPSSPLCPYTTLFRSDVASGSGGGVASRRGWLQPDSCHYLVPISIEIVEEFLGGFGDFGVEGEVLAVDRKSTRLNSSHVSISYAVFCLKKKKDARNL